MAAAVAAAIAGQVLQVAGRNWLLVGASAWVVVALLTGYIVAAIDLDLFFAPQPDLARAERMLRRWMRWNLLRMAVLSVSEAAWVLAIRSLL